MPSSQSWKSDIYLIKNKEFLIRELDCPEILPHFPFYIVSGKEIDVTFSFPSKFYSCKEFFVAPLDYQQLNNFLKITDIINSLKFYKSKNQLRIHGNNWNFERPTIMAILNFTPDSFYESSRITLDKLEEVSEKLKKAEINLIDIGGESTRPSSLPISASEEWSRIEMPLKFFLDKGFTISVDSYKPEIQEKALEMGTHIVNDVKGLESEQMAELVKKFDVPIIIMHSRGEFKSMQDNPYYENTILEIANFFHERLERAEHFGITDNIILDPGIGFGKRVEDNLKIIKYLQELKMGYPLLMGLSRKSFLGKILDERPEERLISTVIMNTISIINGADIIRVHDFAEHAKLIKLFKKMNEL